MAKVGMVDAPEVNAIAAVNGAQVWYRPVGCPVPAPGAAQNLAGEPQPDRSAVLAGGLLDVMLEAFALTPFPPLHQWTVMGVASSGGVSVSADTAWVKSPAHPGRCARSRQGQVGHIQRHQLRPVSCYWVFRVQ